MAFIIGIDPGISGGIGTLDVARGEASLIPTPTVWLKKGKGRKREYDLAAMFSLLIALRGEGCILAGVERGGGRPNQDSSSVYRTGFGVGLWIGLLTGVLIPWRYVDPPSWKKHHALIHQDKRASRLLVQQRWPSLGRVGPGLEGAAEGLLMAQFVASKEGIGNGNRQRNGS